MGRKTPAKILDNNTQLKLHIQKALDNNPGVLDRIWADVLRKAEGGSDKHQTLLFNYFYGKPKENLEQPQEMTINVKHES